MIDVKGEYGPLVEALGRRTIRLERGAAVRLNSIDRRGDRESQLALLRSVALAALRRDLHPRGRRHASDGARPVEVGNRRATQHSSTTETWLAGDD